MTIGTSTGTVPTVLAWKSDPALKAQVMQRLHAHRAADTIVQGFYQLIDHMNPLGYRGCALGCTLPKGAVDGPGPERWWQAIEDSYGIGRGVAALIDGTFEDQASFEEAAQFAVDVIDAIPVGADLSRIDKGWDDDQMDDAEPAAGARWLINALADAPVPEDAQ